MDTITCNNFNVYRRNIPLFKPISFALKAGDCLRIYGGNAVGKTSCLFAMAGLKAYAGTLSIGANSLLTHSNGLYESLLVQDMLAFWAQNNTGITSKISCKLPGDKHIFQLSSGQKRLLAWHRLLIENKKIWLLDEPLTNLDSHNKTFILGLVGEFLESGGTVIVVTHLDNLWESIITQKTQLERT